MNRQSDASKMFDGFFPSGNADWFSWGDFPLLLAPLFLLGVCWLLYWRQSLFLRPSTLFMIGTNLLLQWPAIWKTEEIDSLPQPFDWYAIAFGLPWAWLAWTWYLNLKHPAKLEVTYKAARRLAIDCEAPGGERGLYACWFLAIPIAALYLAYVPIRSTGLWTMLFDPLSSNDAREESWKLIQSGLVRYTFGWLVHILAPILVFTHFLSWLDAKRAGRVEGMAMHLGFAFVAMLFSCLSGHRTTAVLVMFGCALLYWILTGLRYRLYWLGLAAVVLLLIPAVMTVQREGRGITIEAVASAYGDVVGSRMAEVPVDTTVAYCEYVQRHGYFWGDTIRQLATLRGNEPVNLPNIIGVAYFYAGLDTVSMNTGIMVSFYADFALPGALLLTSLVLFAVDKAAAWIASLSPGRVAAVLLVVWGNSCVVGLLEAAAPVTLVSGGLWLVLGIAKATQIVWNRQQQEAAFARSRKRTAVAP